MMTPSFVYAPNPQWVVASSTPNNVIALSANALSPITQPMKMTARGGSGTPVIVCDPLPDRETNEIG